jgi:hypothetical protein
VWIAARSASSLTIVTGQQATTAGAVRLPSSATPSQVTFTAPSSNAATLAIGPAGVTLATGYPLAPGQSVTLPISNTNALYLIGANTTDKITWIGF